jgi:DNA-binding MarR family transcriptional regulator
VTRIPDPLDRRRKQLGLTRAGQRLVRRLVGKAFKVSRDTLAPLGKREQTLIEDLLARLG